MSVKKSNLLIGGQMCPPASGQYYPLYSPVNGTLVAEVADANPAYVDRAAAAAREAFYTEWKFCGIEHKRALFAKLKEALYAMADELAAAKVQPQGGKGIPPMIERIIDYYVAKLDDGAGTLIEHSDQRTNYICKEPLGVVAIFAPFNGPMLGAILSVVPALVAGNTVVLKAPDQEAPQAIKTMQAFHEAGFPAGVVRASRSFRRWRLWVIVFPGMLPMLMVIVRFWTGMLATQTKPSGNTLITSSTRRKALICMWGCCPRGALSGGRKQLSSMPDG